MLRCRSAGTIALAVTVVIILTLNWVSLITQWSGSPRHTCATIPASRLLMSGSDQFMRKRPGSDTVELLPGWKGWLARSESVHGSNMCQLCECKGNLLKCFNLKCPGASETNHVEGKAVTVPKVAQKTRLLCCLPVKWPPGSAVKAILDTWGPHCDGLVMTSTGENLERHIHKVEGLVPGKNLWMITLKMWEYVYDNFASDYDWFLKVDDDTIVFPENFKMAVSNLSSNDTYYMGHTSYHGSTPFNNGCGYALSRAALESFAPAVKMLVNGTSYSSECTPDATWAEDSRMGKCMNALGIKPTPTIDDEGRERSMAFNLKDHLAYVRRPDSRGWYFVGQPKSLRHGADCCSSRPILFHSYKEKHDNEALMYFYYWMYYHFDVNKIDK